MALLLSRLLGLTTWVFQDGTFLSLLGVETASPVVSFLPVLLIAILFGLSMDYEVFLVSRMRESHARGAAPPTAIVDGFRASARVVTAAAVIMVAVFLAFVSSEDLTVKSIAFALAFGVLADALLVRMTLVPAVIALLRRHAWTLPRALERALLRLDIEGERLIAETSA